MKTQAIRVRNAQCDHAALKADRQAFAALELRGLIDGGGTGSALELRNCDVCHSTLAVEVPAIETDPGDLPVVVVVPPRPRTPVYERTPPPFVEDLTFLKGQQ